MTGDRIVWWIVVLGVAVNAVIWGTALYLLWRGMP